MPVVPPADTARQDGASPAVRSTSPRIRCRRRRQWLWGQRQEPARVDAQHSHSPQRRTATPAKRRVARSHTLHVVGVSFYSGHDAPAESRQMALPCPLPGVSFLEHLRPALPLLSRKRSSSIGAPGVWLHVLKRRLAFCLTEQMYHLSVPLVSLVLQSTFNFELKLITNSTLYWVRLV